ncbi:MAG: hypothetical protein KDJ36_14455 [Hyphomicrobiaceae bacterium]|nr:hypothetical protein [Hyphomicrobiaceae bacterium]
MTGIRLPARSFAVYQPIRSILVAIALTLAALTALIAERSPSPPATDAGALAIQAPPSPQPGRT